MRVTTYNSDGFVTEKEFELSPEMQAKLDEARAHWKKLADAGTPYWCTHEDRDVTHERAYWKPDTWSGPAFDGVHGKHGMMCSDCGGYIQEG